MNNRMLKITLIASLIFVLASCGEVELPPNYFESPIPEVKQTQRTLPLGDLRDYQYCEVLPRFSNDSQTVTEVYATMGCNKCPDEEWKELVADELKDELGAEYVWLNGPRHWVINKIRSSDEVKYDKVASFGDIQMKLSAQIDGEVIELEYVENEVKRWTTYTYKKGNRVYRLVNNLGEKYIMQSYNRGIDEDQTIDDLENLGSVLNLPVGWSFETEVLEENFELVTEGQAFVIVDDLHNAYQKIVD